RPADADPGPAFLSRPIDEFALAGHPGAIRATVHDAVGFDAVPKNPAPAVRARRCKRVHCTLEAVVHAAAIDGGHGERLVVRVSTHITDGHGRQLSVDPRR